MERRSPFKFLNAYDRNDKAIFFGRDEEIGNLYNMVFESNIVLVYGRSGTGKTSLIQCGLANEFDPTDWYDIFIRRKDNLNDSLDEALQKAFNARGAVKSNLALKNIQAKRSARSSKQAAVGTVDTLEGVSTAVSLVERIYRKYMRPVYLIFDQFEELYIIGTKEEQARFYNTVRDILDSCPYCTILIVLREEAIAELHRFEKVVPNLFDKRLRVEPFTRANTVEVIKNTAGYKDFDIELENDKVADDIFEAISGGKGQAELTYLQVFLDALYQEAARTQSKPYVFTSGLVAKLGDIGDVLATFLNEQSVQIQSRLEGQYPNISDKAVRDVLSAFVTLEGTKQPRKVEDVTISGLTSDQIKECVEHLEDARILRFEDDRYEIAHDALAARIAETRSTADISYLEALKTVRDRYAAFKNTNEYLSANDLAFVNRFKARIENESTLDPEQFDFLRASEKELRRKREARTRRIAAVAGVLGIFLVISIITYFNSQKANYERFLQAGSYAMANSSYADADSAFWNAIDMRWGSTSQVRDSLEKNDRLKIAKKGFDSSVRTAQSRQDFAANRENTYMERCDSLIEAREIYSTVLQAQLLSNSDRNEARQRLRAVNIELDAFSVDFERRADIMSSIDDDFGKLQACIFYRQAIRAERNDTRKEVLNEKLQRLNCENFE